MIHMELIVILSINKKKCVPALLSEHFIPLKKKAHASATTPDYGGFPLI